MLTLQIDNDIIHCTTSPGKTSKRVVPNLCLFPLSHFSNVVFDIVTFTGDAKENRFMAEKDEYGADTMTEIHIIGRIVLNLWRVMKTEVYLTLIPPECQS